MMQYKGYLGRVEFDPEAKSLFGRVIGIADVITFQADLPAEIEREFHASVDDYLAFCKELGRAPERPASGKLALRINPALHRDVAMFAEAEGVSINSWIETVLADGAEQYRAALVPSRRPRPAAPVGQGRVSVSTGKGRRPVGKATRAAS